MSLQPQSHEEIMQGRASTWCFRQHARLVCRHEHYPQPLVLASVKAEVRLGQAFFFRTGGLSLDQVIEVWQLHRLVEAN